MKIKCSCCGNIVFPKVLFNYKKGKKILKKRFFCSKVCCGKLSFGRTGKKKIGKISYYKDSTGKFRRFIYLPEHPLSGNNGDISYARWIMETKLGRFLESHEIVHHMNGKTLDDWVGNLRVFKSVSDHILNHKMSNSTCINFYSDNLEILEMLYVIYGTKNYIPDELPNIFNGNEVPLPSINYGNYNEGHSINCLKYSPFFKK